MCKGLKKFFGSMFGNKDGGVSPIEDTFKGAMNLPYYDIVCPKCFTKFSPNDVVFRAGKYYDNSGDFAVGPDEILSEFRRKRGESEVTEIERILDPKTDSNLIKSRNIVDNIIVEITDTRDVKTSVRLCPHCHNILPNSAGRGPCEVISVIGTTQVGKSVFMASLLHTLENVTAGNFNAGCIPTTTKYAEELSKLERTIYDEGRLLPATQKVDTIEPLILNFKFKDNSQKPITFMFFDVAGEGMLDNDYVQSHAEHIANSTGIIFLVDPLQLRAVSGRITALETKLKDSITDISPKQILSNLFNNILIQKSGFTNDIPTAVVITKSDLLNVVKGDYIQEGSNIFKNYHHKDVFNLNEFNNINGEVGRFLGEVDNGFKNAIEAYFSKYSYLAVSALGSNPENQRITGVVNSTRIDEPLLWIMKQRGYIRAGREGV